VRADRCMAGQMSRMLRIAEGNPHLLRVLDTLRLIALPLVLRRTLQDRQSAFYRAFPELGGRAVVRDRFLIDLCSGKRVLHFGFLDAPFTADRYRSGELLHSRFRQVAQSLFGVDINQDALATYRDLSGDMENRILDIQSPVEMDGLENRFDVVVFGEILEHLSNPQAALANLRAISMANNGCEICITTPNAFYLATFLMSLTSREIVHPEHYYYFSPATLRRLLEDNGFQHVEISFYSSPGTLTAPGLTKAGLIARCRP
jgi:methyltransferase family protein